jgi:type II secretory pathway pseudopilin PulG
MTSAIHWKDRAGFLLTVMLIAIVIVATFPASAQQVNDQERVGSASSLFIALFANGDALVEQNVEIENPLAEEVRIKLFGDDVSDLVVVDYEDNPIEFSTGGTPNEILLNRPNATNLRISYTTSDFLSKDRREWIFNVNSTVSLSVKLPPDSILTDPGENPSIVLVGDQQLLTYRPGNVRFVYVIGTLGTEEQANIVIRAAETTILQVNNNYPGIVLTSANDLLQRAINERDESRFTEAERLADQANDAAIATGREYAMAQEVLANAEAQINNAGESRTLDHAAIREILVQANNQFSTGNYTQAISSAQDAVLALADSESSQPEIPMSIIIITSFSVAGAAGGGIGAILFLKKRRRNAVAVAGDSPGHIKPIPQIHKPNNISNDLRNDIPNANVNDTDARSSPGALSKPGHSLAPVNLRQDVVEDLQRQHQEMPDALEQTNISPISGISADPQIDRSILSRIVGNILTEKPHLRPEDQQVLKFLAEKEGAVFESEIRSKFQIPKTTIWRLVKRLEREELVEIRKAGGQNLIKLRYEDRQA